MNRLDLVQRFDSAIYNNLISVEEADRIVRENHQLDGFLAAAAKTILSYNLQDRFGVTLLHKHNECLPNEWMVELEESFEGQDVLVTRPSRRSPNEAKSVPISWQIIDKEFRPIEYSADPLAQRLFEEGNIPDRFLAEFYDLTRESLVGSLLGLAIVDRGLYEKVTEQDIAVEKAHPRAERSNLVSIRPRWEQEGDVIETNWSFKQRPDTTLTCLTSCRKQCWSEPGGHRKEHNKHHHVDPTDPD